MESKPFKKINFLSEVVLYYFEMEDNDDESMMKQYKLKNNGTKEFHKILYFLMTHGAQYYLELLLGRKIDFYSVTFLMNDDDGQSKYVFNV